MDKIENKYTYSNLISDTDIKKFSALTPDEIRNIINNDNYANEIITGIENYRISQMNKEMNKTKQKVYMPKAGFMDVGMFIDLLIVSIAIIMLVMVILGTRY